MNESTPADAPAAGPNLMILKGVVWGLGVLLLLGFALVAALITMGPSGDEDEYAPEGLEIPLMVGETVASSSVEDGQLYLVVENADGLNRIVIIDMRTNEAEEIPLSVRRP